MPELGGAWAAMQDPTIGVPHQPLDAMPPAMVNWLLHTGSLTHCPNWGAQVVDAAQLKKVELRSAGLAKIVTWPRSSPRVLAAVCTLK